MMSTHSALSRRVILQNGLAGGLVLAFQWPLRAAPVNEPEQPADQPDGQAPSTYNQRLIYLDVVGIFRRNQLVQDQLHRRHCHPDGRSGTIDVCVDWIGRDRFCDFCAGVDRERRDRAPGRTARARATAS